MIAPSKRKPARRSLEAQYQILSRGSFAWPAVGEAPTFGRTSIGISRDRSPLYIETLPREVVVPSSETQHPLFILGPIAIVFAIFYWASFYD
jgi:hypothetical protein